jgi:A/G-specific adenine glycosylase
MVVRWGRTNLRPLPWRATRDPWAVLVSEVMAQQTNVDRVVPKWRELLDRWPDPAALAGAPLSDLLRLWSGLGYPRRAKNLKDAAQVVVDRHGGVVPEDLDALLALPGIGAYTARAVLVFAFEQPVGVVDTNVARVLARHGGRRLTARAAQDLADAWARAAADPWMWNQSVMEIGALCCRPTPRCAGCPVADGCAWARGAVEDDPAIGSAGVSRRQAAYRGSDREARGRLVAAVLTGPVEDAELASRAGLDDDHDRARRVAAGLAEDGLLARRGTAWVAP